MLEGKKEITTRLIIIYVLLLLAWGVAIIFQISKIQFVEGAFWRKEANDRTVMMRDVDAQRGSIYSADGKLLATTVPIYDVYLDLGKEKVAKKGEKELVDEYLIPDSIFNSKINVLCDSLTTLFPRRTTKEYKSFLQKERKSAHRYVPICKNVTLSQLERMKRFPILRMEQPKKKKPTNKPDSTVVPKKPLIAFNRGVILDEKEKRVNPYELLARRTIGIKVMENGCDTCYNGLDGAYDKYLRGTKGKRLERRLAKSIWVPIEDKEYKRAEDGIDVVSTIDVRIQELAENSLRRCLDSNDAGKGCVVLMEVETGYIRAISSLSRTTDGRYSEIENIAVSDLYEPGSTFKTITAMMMLEDNVCDTSTLVPTGARFFNKEEIKDVNRKDYGMVSFKRAFEVSSNVGISSVAFNNYKNRRKDFYNGIVRTFPFNRLGLDLNVREPNPTLLQDLSPDRNFLNLAYGYGSNMTPLQLLTFHNAVANNGKMVKPLFASDLLKAGKLEKHFEPVVMKEKVCSDKTLKQIQDFLKSVVKNGTARKLSTAPYGIAGKTGTAQVGYENKSEKLKYRASFVGYFPSDQPKYSCIVLIIDPGKNRTHGGELAAPVFREIADRVCGTRLDIEIPLVAKENRKLPIVPLSEQKDLYTIFDNLGIAYKDNGYNSKWILTQVAGEDSISYNTFVPKNNIMPGVEGMTIKDALYLLENMGLKVTFEGRGKVKDQSLPMGSAFRKGDRVHLVLG